MHLPRRPGSRATGHVHGSHPSCSIVSGILPSVAPQIGQRGRVCGSNNVPTVSTREPMRRIIELPPGVTATTIRTERTSHAVLVAEAEAARGVVVLVPGWTGSKEDFAAILPLLAA